MKYGIILQEQTDRDLWTALNNIKEDFDLDIMENIDRDILMVVKDWLGGK